MNVIYQLMTEDFRYSKTLDQISQSQANEIVRILDNQGFKTVDDINQAFEERVIESTKGMKNIQYNSPKFIFWIINIINTLYFSLNRV